MNKHSENCETATCDNNVLGDDFLDLKKIVAYLPYELRLFNKKNRQIETLKALNESGTLYTGSFFNDWNHIYNFKPILRPLSDLIKEIELNGEKFVPMVELAKIHGMQINGEIFLFSNNTFYEINIDNKKFLQYHLKYKKFEHYGYCKQYELEMFEKLREWHLDIYGLIENGLAISIHDVG